MKIILQMSLWLPLLLIVAVGCVSPEPYYKGLSAGGDFGCALDSKIDGVVCWGDNSAGQTSVPPLSRPSAIAAGLDFACALDADKLVCWGNDPTSGVLGLSSPFAVTAGKAHVCILDANGVSCAGNNDELQLDVPTLLAPTEISAAGDRSCALDGSAVLCWGDSTNYLPVAVSGPSHLAVGDRHFCVISAGQVVCAGNEPDVVSNIPVVSNPIALSSGNGYACVIDDAGVQCWGDAGLSSVLNVRDLTLPWDISAGGNGVEAHACVHHLQGIQCWGDNSKNQATYNAYPLPNGYPYHVLMRADVVIDATPEEVWAVLIDLDNYYLWNPLSVAVDSTLQVGDTAVLNVHFNDALIFDTKLTVRVNEPNYKLCWGLDDGARELATGERCQWLESVPLEEGGGTRYVSEDHYEGTSTPGLYQIIGDDLEAGFAGIVSGLKTRVEGL